MQDSSGLLKRKGNGPGYDGAGMVNLLDSNISAEAHLDGVQDGSIRHDGPAQESFFFSLSSRAGAKARMLRASVRMIILIIPD